VIALLALHAAFGLVIITFGSRVGRHGFALGAIPLVATLVWFLFQADNVLDGDAVTSSTSWVGTLGLSIDLRLDGFAALMLLLVAGIGAGVFAYSLRYFPPVAPGLGRLAGLLVLFAGSMLGLVLADNLLVLSCCWELTSITSYLLIGNDHTKTAARAAALQALLVTSAGGLAMLLGFVLIAEAGGTYRLSELLASPPSSTTVTVGLVLVAIGAFTKSAQYPFHSWLPGAMTAPTPVSAYLHAATMVKAGVYLVARFAPAFAHTAGWRPLVLTTGVVTMLFGGLRALRQHDLKLLLAFGTVSQLGFLMVLAGAGSPEATTAACVMLLAHGAFKGALFMVVGMLDHQLGTRDIRRLPQVGAGWGPTKAITALSALSMAGVMPLLGFVGKEAAYDALVHADFWGGGVVLAGVVVGSVLTFAYSARLWWGAFAAPRTSPTAAGAAAATPPSAWLVVPAAVLTAASLVLGLVPGSLDRLVGAAGSALDASVDDVHLALWHGVNRALVLSIVAIAAGLVVFLMRRRVAKVLGVGARVPSGEDAYREILRGANSAANWITGVLQNGSLPVYAGVILLTAAATPAAAMLIWGSAPDMPDVVDAPAHVPIAVVLLGSALCAATVRRRVSAALFLGMVGYSMAALFVAQGAPDLALTQAAIETLSTVLFVLVLRRLPDRFERTRMPLAGLIRVGVATVVGMTVFAFAIYAGAQPRPEPPPVAAEMIERAQPDGHGKNVVNVILVDFRGFDTMGEITVLAAAAIGAVALARAGRQPQHGSATTTRRPDRLLYVDVSVRVVFPIVILASLWLLFAGHNQPGGGFAGGLLAGAAISLRYVAGGIDEVRRLSRFRPWTILGTGLLLSATTAAAPLLFDHDVLDAAFASFDLPLLGEVNLSSALAFDVGVYVLVVGLMLMVFESFGDDPPREHLRRRVADSEREMTAEVSS
ncbi:MAG TPA: hydrogen gas-evolving membrane-bound hydrogenase subunit E, partial [Acidimicrobiales bacterium]